MTNKHKGEFSFDALGKTWTGRLSLNVLAELEEKFDMGTAELFAMIETKPRIKHLIALFHAGMRRNHPELTPEIVGELLGEVVEARGLDAVGDIFSDATAAAFPNRQGGDGGEADGPLIVQPPAVGTGPAS